jgi:tetratricopeptide (TPR) repeat protein
MSAIVDRRPGTLALAGIVVGVINLGFPPALLPGLQPDWARAAEPTAGTVRETEELIQQGISLREAGRDRAALPYFERAHALMPNPRTVAQLGFVEQALGMWPEAEAHIALALAASGDLWVQKHRPVIQDSADFIRRQLGSVVLETNVAGADLLVDGRAVARTPVVQPLRIAAGAHQFELRAAGFRGARSFAVAAGQTQKLTLAAEPFDLHGDTTARPAGPSTVALGLEEPAAHPATSPPIYQRWWFWAGAAALAAGVVAVSLAASGGQDDFPCGEAGRICVPAGSMPARN